MTLPVAPWTEDALNASPVSPACAAVTPNGASERRAAEFPTVMTPSQVVPSKWSSHRAQHHHQQHHQQQQHHAEGMGTRVSSMLGPETVGSSPTTRLNGTEARQTGAGNYPGPEQRDPMPSEASYTAANTGRVPPWVGAPGSNSRLQGTPVASGPPPGTKPWQGTSASAGRARHAVDTYNNQSWPPSEAEGQAADWSSPTPYVSHVDVNRRGMAPGRPGTQMGVPQGAPWASRPPVARPHASRHVMRVPRRPPPRPAHYGYYAHRPASFKQMGYHHGPTGPRPVHYHGYTRPAAVPADWYDYTADPELQYCDCPACQSHMDHDYYDGADDYSDVVHNVGVPLRHRYYTHSAPPPPTWVDEPHPRSHVSPHLLRPVHSSTHSFEGHFEDPAWVDMHEPSHTPVMPREQGAADYMPRLQTTRPWDAPPQTGGQPPADVYAAPHIGTSPPSFRSRQFARHESSESSYPTGPVWSHHARGPSVIAAADMHDAHRDCAATGKPAGNWGPTEAADDYSWGQGQQQTHRTDTAAVPLMNGTGEGVSGDNGMPGARQPPGQDARHSMEQHAVYGSDAAYETGHGGSQNRPVGNGHDSQVYQGRVDYAHLTSTTAPDKTAPALYQGSGHQSTWHPARASYENLTSWQVHGSSNGSQTGVDAGGCSTNPAKLSTSQSSLCDKLIGELDASRLETLLAADGDAPPVNAYAKQLAAHNQPSHIPLQGGFTSAGGLGSDSPNHDDGWASMESSPALDSSPRRAGATLPAAAGPTSGYPSGGLGSNLQATAEPFRPDQADASQPAHQAAQGSGSGEASQPVPDVQLQSAGLSRTTSNVPLQPLLQTDSRAPGTTAQPGPSLALLNQLAPTLQHSLGADRVSQPEGVTRALETLCTLSSTPKSLSAAGSGSQMATPAPRAASLGGQVAASSAPGPLSLASQLLESIIAPAQRSASSTDGTAGPAAAQGGSQQLLPSTISQLVLAMYAGHGANGAVQGLPTAPRKRGRPKGSKNKVPSCKKRAKSDQEQAAGQAGQQAASCVRDCPPGNRMGFASEARLLDLLRGAHGIVVANTASKVQPPAKPDVQQTATTLTTEQSEQPDQFTAALAELFGPLSSDPQSGAVPRPASRLGATCTTTSTAVDGGDAHAHTPNALGKLQSFGSSSVFGDSGSDEGRNNTQEAHNLQGLILPRDVLYSWAAAGTLPVNAPGFLIRTLGTGCWEALLGHATAALEPSMADVEVWYECGRIESVNATPAESGTEPTQRLVVRFGSASDAVRHVKLEEVSNEVPPVSEVSHWLHRGGSISSEEASMLRSRFNLLASTQ